ncbi:hypothetical protein [Nannocystis bainbridge]|uniref:Lipoprotein n=1 Tax=Nannocystis bainbridge TaxID=2995303 RepID=A0ABT5DQT9_9BACT|nr:hypothetical protein [Nannocystis bainbridge]MDC0715498.1 hypothetical protein [Nannocystis bainbridge]
MLVACAPREPPAPVPAPAPTPVTAPVTTPAPSASPPAPPEPAIESPTPVESKPSEPLTPSKTWPFVVWDRAEAFTFNHLLYGPGIPLRVWDATSGWSPKIVDRKPVTPEQASHAVEWVVATRGDLEVSKCAFPRHAVVLYAGDTPVGSVNVCFECGDILVWPAFEAPATGPAAERRHSQQMKAYKRVFPQWQRFFRDELGFPLTPPLQN